MRASLTALLLLFLIAGVQANNMLQLTYMVKLNWFGLIQGGPLLQMCEYMNEDAPNQTMILTVLDRDKTYLVLVYEVPAEWQDNTAIQFGIPQLRHDLKVNLG